MYICMYIRMYMYVWCILIMTLFVDNAKKKKKETLDNAPHVYAPYLNQSKSLRHIVNQPDSAMYLTVYSWVPVTLTEPSMYKIVAESL